MLKLLNALTPTPFNWSTNTDVCLWSGVSCNSGYVDRIDLSFTSLTGILPSGLNESLFYLTKLDLSINSLSGPFPSLANLQNLQYVDLRHNNFTSIPNGCFQGLVNLQTLILSNNIDLAPWKFPIDLTDSSALNTLYLATTKLIGSLPEIFDSSSNLTVVDLSDNSLSGVLPDLSNCTSLESLYLDNNQLTGVVPPYLMKLSALSFVSLDHNFFQGPFPVYKIGMYASLGDNTSNSFCLDYAGPCDHRVTTLLEISAAFGYPLLLARSWRGNNPCRGWSFIMCDGNKIRTVNLTKLNLTGTISGAFGNLTDLWNLYLGSNNLLGSIPESVATLPELKVLDVSNNNLSGNIPIFSPNVMFTAKGNALLVLSQANGTSPSAFSGDRPSPTASKISVSRFFIPGASAAGVGVIIIIVVVIYNRNCLVQKMMFKKTRSFVDNNFEDFIKKYGSLTLKRYSYSEIKKMTNLFRDKLGQGGYGIVYRACLTDGRQVAVKVLSQLTGSGEEFINEVASISRTSHVNIVSLLGFCYEKKKKALIYEFMSNGSLNKFIYKEGSPNTICDLDWSILFQITISIAQGLKYLHQGCNTKILHLDIKPQNILLDEDFCPKIANFDLAKICKKNKSIVSLLGTRGTPGYIAPEVYSRTYGGVSHKSDVYSFGMLIIDMVGGRKNYESGGSHTSEMYFPDWIYKDLDQGSIPARCLTSSEEENDMVMKITLVSLWCIQQNPSDRPSISKVVEMLEGPLQSVQYPPKPILHSPERSPLQFSNISYSNIHETSSVTA